jgi:hypothetical protein
MEIWIMSSSNMNLAFLDASCGKQNTFLMRLNFDVGFSNIQLCDWQFHAYTTGLSTVVAREPRILLNALLL